MADFLNDKIGFLENFSKGKYTISHILIGFIFSFTQKDIKDKIDLFRSLKRIKNEVPDQNQVCYAVIKSLKSAEVYLEHYQSEEFLDIYCEITSELGSMRIPKSLEGKINTLFSNNWFKIANIYAKTENFYKAFHIGKQNLRLFYRTPIILNPENDSLIKKLLKVDEEPDSETLLSICQLLRTIRFGSNEAEYNILKYFLAFTIKSLFQKTQSLKFVNDLHKKIEEHNSVFDEHTRIELKNDYLARISEKGKVDNIPINNQIQKRKIELNQLQQKDVADFYHGKFEPIKIPVKGYDDQGINSHPNPRLYPNNPKSQSRPSEIIKPDEAPKEISLDNNDIEQNIKLVIQSCLESSKSEVVDENIIKSMLKSFEDSILTFPSNLYKVLMETIENEYNEENFSFWDMMVEISKEFLKKFEISQIINLLSEKNVAKSRNNQVRRGNSKLSLSPRQDDRESDRNQRYLKPDIKIEYKEAVYHCRQIGESKQVEYHSSEKEEFKQHDLRNIKDSPEQFVPVATESVCKEFFEIENIDQAEQPKPEIQLNNSNPNPAEPAEPANCCGYFNSISVNCKEFIEYVTSQTSEIARLNTPIIKLKSLIQEKSPSAKLNLIGSAYTGTYIKGSEVDVNFYDVLHVDPKDLLKSSLISLNLEIQAELPNKLYFSSEGVTYIVHINLDLYYESSSLIKTYCNLDPRCKDLIILAKYWARRVEVYGNVLSGYHISLICITFLQQGSPTILPSLQSQPHCPELRGDIDVWFDKSLEFFSLNTLTLGEVFIYFLSFAKHYALGYIFYPSMGQIVANESEMVFSCCNLFGNNQVSNVFRASEGGMKLIAELEETFSHINSSENLYRIMRI